MPRKSTRNYETELANEMARIKRAEQVFVAKQQKQGYKLLDELSKEEKQLEARRERIGAILADLKKAAEEFQMVVEALSGIPRRREAIKRAYKV